MKREQIIFSILKIPADFLAITLGFSLAYFLRTKLEFIPVIYLWPFPQYLKFVLALTPLWIFIFAIEGLYILRRRPWWREASAIFIATASAMALVIIWIFLTKTPFFSRLIVILAWVMTLILVAILRFLIRAIQLYLYRFGIGVSKVILIGNGGLTSKLYQTFTQNKALGTKVLEVMPSFNLARLKSLVAQFREVNEIILSDPNLSSSEILKILDFCEIHHILFKQVPSLFDVRAANVEVNQVGELPIMEFKKTPLGGWGSILKRIGDIVLSLIFLIVFSPIMLLVALAIKLDSDGPVFYLNERVGPNGPFKLIKFRSMKIEYTTGDKYGGQRALEFEKKLVEKLNAREGGLYKIKNDPRVTRVGRFIRRYSLDELPQFFNVLAGTISLVGPRPHQQREVAHYLKDYRRVMAVKPGVTGLAQISGRSNLSVEEEVRLDNYYVENWSLLLDLMILLKTPAAVFSKRTVE